MEKINNRGEQQAQRDFFALCRTLYEAIRVLPDADMRLRLLEAVMEYGFYKRETITTDTPIEFALFQSIKAFLAYGWRQHENGTKGGAPWGNTNAKRTHPTKAEAINIDAIKVDNGYIGRVVEAQAKRGNLLTYTQVSELLERFCAENEAKGETHTTTRAWKTHFFNWINSNYKRETNENKDDERPQNRRRAAITHNIAEQDFTQGF